MLRQNFVVLLLLFVTLKVRKINATGNDDDMQDVVKEILKIAPPIEPIGEFDPNLEPHKHMLELYHRFTAGKRSTGETIRCVTPITDVISNDNSNEMSFTIANILPEEEVHMAQLMLRRRRISRHPHPLHRKMLPAPYRVRVYEIVKGKDDERIKNVPLASIPVPQVTRGGWHSLDITSAVRELFLTTLYPAEKYNIGVRFEAPKSKVIPLSHFLDQRENSTAFLMLFTAQSDDNELPKFHKEKELRIAKEHVKVSKSKENAVKQRHHSPHNNRKMENTYNNPRRHKNKTSNDNKQQNENDELDQADINELINFNEIKQLKRHKKLFDDFDVKYDDERESQQRIEIKSNLIDELLENSETKRVIRSPNESKNAQDKLPEVDKNKDNKNHRRRSIYDNELPFEKLHIKSHSKTLTATTDQTEVATEFTLEGDKDDRNLMSFPVGTAKKQRRKWRRARKKNHRVSKVPDESNKNLELHMRSNLSRNQTCSKKHLVVNFKEFAWDWVIAPKLFNAHYCFGSCAVPLPKSVPVTNHAIIQSLVHKGRFHKDVPPPCCVPHSMNSFTILYIEDKNHVILKNYKNMTVETCGCR